MPTYPSGSSSFTTPTAGTTVQPSHIGQFPPEVLALEADHGFTTDTALAATTRGKLLRLALLQGSDVASAATITIPADGSRIRLTGTTTVSEFTTGTVVRAVLLELVSGLTLRHLNHIHLAGGVDVAYPAGAQLLFVWNGSGWYEVGAPYWATTLSNPLTTQDDLVLGGAAGVVTRLPKGGDGQVLTVDPTTHHVLWAPSAAGFSNPMIAANDLIVGGTAGTGTRLAKGTDGQILTVDPTTHNLLWATPAALTNPMTTVDDVIVGGTAGAPGRLPKGGDGQVLTIDPTTHHVLWANSASGFANPMVAPADLIVGGAAGTGTRLAKGSDGQVLTVDPTTHLLVWATPSGGLSNPMTTAGDLIKGGSSGTPGRLGIGSTGDVLTVVSGAPAWAAPSGGGSGWPPAFRTVVAPVLTGLTAVNGATIAAAQVGSSVVINGNASEATQNFHLLVQTAANAHWHFRALVYPSLGPVCALMWLARDSTTGKFVAALVAANPGGYQQQFDAWASATSYGSGISGAVVAQQMVPIWLHVYWDGTNIDAGYSADGNYPVKPYRTQPGAVGWAGGHTPDQFGLGLSNNNTAVIPYAAIWSWEEVALP